jgi:hypothetical protein
MKPPGDRFVKHFIPGWNKWVVLDLKYQRENEVRDWRKKGLPGKQPIWRGTEEDADNLAVLLNKAYRDDDALITKVERDQSDYVPWQNKGKAKRKPQAVAPVTPFKKCSCGARFKGDKHCD